MGVGGGHSLIISKVFSLKEFKSTFKKIDFWTRILFIVIFFKKNFLSSIHFSCLFIKNVNYFFFKFSTSTDQILCSLSSIYIK